MKKLTLAAVAASFALAGIANGANAATSVVSVTIANNTPVALTYVPGKNSCIGTTSPAWPTSIPAGGTSGTINGTSTLTSNGCYPEYKRSDTGAYCSWAATRIESGLPPAPWNYPTVNTTTSGSITCSNSITSVSTNGNWSVTLSGH